MFNKNTLSFIALSLGCIVFGNVSGDGVNQNYSSSSYYTSKDGYQSKSSDNSNISQNYSSYSTSNAKLNDPDLQKMVQEKVSNDNVTIQVRDGTVTLTGFVDSASEKQSLADDVHKIKGVKNIINNLQVK